MSARERFEQLCADWSINLHGSDLLEILDEARLGVIDQPEPPYDLIEGEPADGSVTHSTGDDDLGRHLPVELVALISAAHIRTEDYR